jgi:hypothetical protein
MANVFFVSPDLGSEDPLTAYWPYVLDAVPGIGQAFVDDVSSPKGLAIIETAGSVRSRLTRMTTSFLILIRVSIQACPYHRMHTRTLAATLARLAEVSYLTL